jgi:hypothetical protein
MKTGFLCILASAVGGLNRKPRVPDSLAVLWRWVFSFLHGQPRHDDFEFRRLSRRYQWRALPHGKARAIEEIHRARGAGCAE